MLDKRRKRRREKHFKLPEKMVVMLSRLLLQPYFLRNLVQRNLKLKYKIKDQPNRPMPNLKSKLTLRDRVLVSIKASRRVAQMMMMAKMMIKRMKL